MAYVSEADVDAGAWSTLRSELMAPIRICLPTDDQVAISTIRALANTGIVQILDANAEVSLTQRRYKQEVASCIECLRLLRGLETEVRMADNEEKGLFDRNDEDVGMGVIHTDLEQPLEKLLGWNGEVQQFNHVLADVTKNRNQQVEMKEVLLRSGDFLAYAEADPLPPPSSGPGVEMSDMSTGLLEGRQPDIESQQGDQLLSVSGVVRTEQQENFARALFRALRGLVIIKFKVIDDEIVDPESGAIVFKTAFTAFFHGEQAQRQVNRIASAYAASIYEVPKDAQSRDRLVAECEDQIATINKLVEQTKKGKLQVLRAFYQQVVPIKAFVKQEFVVFNTLNMFKQSPTGTMLMTTAWMPAYGAETVKMALEEGAATGGKGGGSSAGYMESIDENESQGWVHPTFIRTNKFTAPFQGIVNTYGTPRYREINPGFFAVAMFPFLFGVMFGDIVHGLLLFFFALYFVVFEDRYADHDYGEIFQMIYSARYLLLIMGICATYMGFIYNESLSIAINFFGPSAYHSGESFPEHPYIFGIDSVWRHSGNLIQFTNSLKMKMSIVIGVSQMYFGIFLKLLNNLHMGRYFEMLVESVPELLFMGLTFGYMSGLIFIKWSINYPSHPDCFAAGCEGQMTGGYPLTAAPPSIIMLMIDMFKLQDLKPQNALYPGQQEFQRFILTIAVCSLPVLLIGKPWYVWMNMSAHAEAREDAGYEAVEGEEDPEANASEEHSMGDVIVHQGIHTVEFALGCVSNTASYLRLWALSLAHSQLSEVFWEYIFVGYNFSLFGNSPGIAGGATTLIPCYFVFFGCTIGILMCMESLSAFLHALRLQWVEFQSKFYAADGIMFVPLTFDNLGDDA